MPVHDWETVNGKREKGREIGRGTENGKWGKEN